MTKRDQRQTPVADGGVSSASVHVDVAFHGSKYLHTSLRRSIVGNVPEQLPLALCILPTNSIAATSKRTRALCKVVLLGNMLMPSRVKTGAAPGAKEIANATKVHSLALTRNPSYQEHVTLPKQHSLDEQCHRMPNSQTIATTSEKA